MKKGKNIQSNSSQKESVQAGDSGSGLAIGLSLGVLFGIVTDNIGLGCSCSLKRWRSRCGSRRTTCSTC